MEREHGHFDREGHREGQEQPGLGRRAQRQAVERLEVEGGDAGDLAVVEVEPQDRHQHEHAAGHGVEEELHRRVDAPLSPPDPDQQVHRDQHRLPEHVEQQQVEGEEGAEHPGLEREQQRVVVPGPLRHRAVGAHDREQRGHGGEQHQQRRDPVHAQVVAGTERREPGAILDELERRSPRHQPPPQRQREQQLGDRDRGGPAADQPVGLAREQHQDPRAQQREEDQPRQPRGSDHPCLRKWSSRATTPSVKNRA